jgi:hypothetical protein
MSSVWLATTNAVRAHKTVFVIRVMLRARKMLLACVYVMRGITMTALIQYVLLATTPALLAPISIAVRAVMPPI